MKFLNDLARPKKPGLPKQIIRIMKLTAIIMTTVLLQLSAATYSQQVTLKSSSIKLEKVFSEIRKQTGYTVLYRNDALKDIPAQKVNLQNTPLEQALDQLLKDKGLEYTISDKAVTIRKKQPTLIDKIINMFDNIDINGKVTDEQNQPLPGATIKIKGTNKTYTTDQNGNFYIQNVDENAILVISYIGYGQKEIKAEKDLSVSLILISSDLHEVVVNKGYYSQKKELLTGSVRTVTASEIEKQSVSNPLATLAGRIPGLELNQTTGVPGGGFSIQIRGKGSLRNGTDPLFIIDNVPFVASGDGSGRGNVSRNIDIFSTINPQDIESIEVLTDADATAIYGARGANGVILITTKKGKAGATKVSVNGTFGLARPTSNLHLLNTQQYLEMRKEAYLNDGLPIPDQSLPANQKNASNYDLTTWDQNRYTDWQKVLIGNTARYTDMNITLAGGSSNTQFSLGSNYHKETTNMPGDFAMQRANVRLNLNHQSTDSKLKVGLSAFYSKTANRTPGDNLVSSIFLAPNAPTLYNSDGSLNWENSTWTNPYSSLNVLDKGDVDNINASLNLSYEFLPGFNLKLVSGLGSSIGKNTYLKPKSSFDPANTFAQAMATYADQGMSNWNIEPQLNFKRTFGQGHHFEALAGLAFNEQKSSLLYQFGIGFSNDALLENRQAATTLIQAANDFSQYRYTSTYARIGYDYKEKYVLNLTGRRDGSSRFGPGKKFGTFGAVGAAWLFSKENFIANTLPFLSLGKIRASYGITGNDQIGDYQYLSVYTPRTPAFQGVTPLFGSGVTNPDYAWESTRKAEIGLDLGFFKDRVNFGATYYQNRSSNQLSSFPLPFITGSNGVIANIPAVIQNTGLELTLNTVNLKSGKFSWTTNYNFTLPKNKLISYPDLANSPYISTYFEGKTINLAKTYKYNGVDPQTGLYTVIDYNKDGVISYSDDRESYIDVSQQFNGAIENTLRIGRTELSFLFQFVKRNNARNYYSTLPVATAGYSGYNMPDIVLNRWQHQGDVTDIQKYSTGTGITWNSLGNVLSSDLTYSDASYIRLRTLSLAYDLPDRWKQAIKASNASIFLQGQNLLTFTNYFGIDPETLGSVGPNRVFTIGGRISF